jgi:hypothetical protein
MFISKCLLTTLTVPPDLITLALLEMITDLLLPGLIFVATDLQLQIKSSYM